VGEGHARNVLIAVLAFAWLVVPTVANFYRAPPWPVNLFPYALLLYMPLGGGWLYILSRRQPGVLGMIEADLEQALQASAHAAALSEERDRLDGLGRGLVPGEIAGAALAPE
jgi:hypothetical protein